MHNHSVTTRLSLAALLCAAIGLAHAQETKQVVDIPTRPGVTQRILVLTPAAPKATVLLFAGGHGGLQLQPNGSWKWGGGNFLIRSRMLFVEQGFRTVIVDAPSDRQDALFLDGFRNDKDHARDIGAVIAWARTQSKAPVWLIGTSRGTESAAFAATELLGPDGPDGVVLTSTILRDDRGFPVTAMPTPKLRIPVLVIHHEGDVCRYTSYSDISLLMNRLDASPRKTLMTFRGGQDVGDPCGAQAYHGYNGIEQEVIGRAAAWMLSGS